MNTQAPPPPLIIRAAKQTYEVEAVKGSNSTRLYRQETKRINGTLVTKRVLLCQHAGSHDECIAEANGDSADERLVQQEKEALAVVPVQQIRREMRRGDWGDPDEQPTWVFPEGEQSEMSMVKRRRYERRKQKQYRDAKKEVKR